MRRLAMCPGVDINAGDKVGSVLLLLNVSLCLATTCTLPRTLPHTATHSHSLAIHSHSLKLARHTLPLTHTHSHSLARNTQDGNTPLHAAALAGNVEAISVLVDTLGVDVDARNKVNEQQL